MALRCRPLIRTRTRGSRSWPTASCRKAGYVFADCSDRQTQTTCRRGGLYVWARCRDVGTNDGGIKHLDQVGRRVHRGEGIEEGLKHTTLAQSIETLPDRIQCPKCSGNARQRTFSTVKNVSLPETIGRLRPYVRAAAGRRETPSACVPSPSPSYSSTSIPTFLPVGIL